MLSHHEEEALRVATLSQEFPNILKIISLILQKEFKHLKAFLGPASVTVLDRRGPPWHSVRYGFGLEGAPLALRLLRFWIGRDPLGTSSVTVLDRRGPPWHSVSHGFGLEGAPLALR